MLNRLRPALAGFGAALATALLLAVCEHLVYQQRPAFSPPPDSTSGFLGYYQASHPLTTCGNCHVCHQPEWAHSTPAPASVLPIAVTGSASSVASAPIAAACASGAVNRSS